MIFTHRNEPSRTATLSKTKDDPPTFTVEHTDESGKTRKKSFKNKWESRAHDAAIRFLLNKEGYILRQQDAGPVRWMARLLQSYMGEIGHDVDTSTGVVWVTDSEDQLHRITPGTCATETVPLGTGMQSPAARVQCGAGDEAWVRTTTYRKDDGILIPLYRLLHARREGGELAVREMSRCEGVAALRSLSSSADGRLLGPAVGGAALYSATGEVEREWPLEALTLKTEKKASPVGALSRNGRWVALCLDGAVRRVDLQDGTESTLAAEFEQVMGVQVSDGGDVFVSGFCYPSWGLYRLVEGGQRLLSRDVRATVDPDGARFIEAESGRVRVRDARAESEAEMEIMRVVASAQLNVLGMAKHGRAVFGPDDSVVILTDAYTVANVKLSDLPPA